MADTSPNMNSILASIKQLLGPSALDTHFDPDIVMHINTALASLTEFGIGPEDGYVITGEKETWNKFLGDAMKSQKAFSMIRSYVYLRVRKLFDPPQSSVLMNAIDKEIDELEWRITVWADYVKSKTTSSG